MKSKDQLTKEYVDSELRPDALIQKVYAAKDYEAGFDAGFQRAVEMLRSIECYRANEPGFTGPEQIADWLVEHTLVPSESGEKK